MKKLLMSEQRLELDSSDSLGGSDDGGCNKLFTAFQSVRLLPAALLMTWKWMFHPRNYISVRSSVKQ